MIAVIVVRNGVLPAGADETICEADRRTLVVGSGLGDVLDAVAVHSRTTWTLAIEPHDVTWTAMARAIAAALRQIDTSGDTIILPASPDGRDLAPLLAFVLDRPLVAGAVHIHPNFVTVARRGGLHLLDVKTPAPVVATLQIGLRGADPRSDTADVDHDVIELPVSGFDAGAVRTIEPIDIQPPDASTMDLAEAPRILGGGAGLGDEEAFDQLQRVAAALGASMGVTRVITDRGWAEHTRQIGTTGVVVDPRLYISFGISGAVQHTSGLGHPDHIISVNTDAHCPMMQISDVAIVADANVVLDELESRLVLHRMTDGS